jgi:hypothetical protein
LGRGGEHRRAERGAVGAAGRRDRRRGQRDRRRERLVPAARGPRVDSGGEGGAGEDLLPAGERSVVA